MTRDERPFAVVPAACWRLVATAALLHGMLALTGPQHAIPPDTLAPAPTAAQLRLLSLDEPAAASRVAMLHLQSADLSGRGPRGYRELDYSRVLDWLRAAVAADARSAYPFFAAARIYAEHPDAEKVRAILDFIYTTFPDDPNRRWPALAQAAYIAKHRLRDLPLARRYAAAIDRLTTADDVPMWAKQMEIFILEDMNDFEAARIMLGGLLASGRLRDAGEIGFLRERLAEIEKRASESKATAK